MPETTADHELIRAFARRDPSAAQALFARFAPRVFGLGLVMLGNPSHAEDLVQDTFVKIWRKADTYEPSRGSLDTWVLLIGRSLAIDSIRRRVLEAKFLSKQDDPGDVSREPE